MKNYLKMIALPLSMLLLVACTATAGQQPNLLVMGEDGDPDTIPRDSRIFNQVLRSIETELNVRGFRIYDETALSLDVTDTSRVRRSDSEILALARRIPDVPIDAVVLFSIFASTEDNLNADITGLRLRITGRILSLPNGEALANYELGYDPNQLPPLPANCNRECLLEEVGYEARRVGSDVAHVLATHLDHLSPKDETERNVGRLKQDGVESQCVGLSSAYTLTFRHFSSSEISRIEEYLVAFQGYEHYRPTRIGTTEAMYWYETCADVERLNRNLRTMVEHMDIEYRMEKIGNTFDLEKIRIPETRG